MSRFGNGLKSRQQLAEKVAANQPEPSASERKPDAPEPEASPDLNAMPLPKLKAIVRAYTARLQSKTEEYQHTPSDAAKRDIDICEAFLARAAPVLAARADEETDKISTTPTSPETSAPPMTPEATTSVTKLPSLPPNVTRPPHPQRRPLSTSTQPSHTTSDSLSSPSTTTFTPFAATLPTAPANRDSVHSSSSYSSSSSSSSAAPGIRVLPVGEGPVFHRTSKGTRVTATSASSRTTPSLPGLTSAELATAGLAAAGGSDALSGVSASSTASKVAEEWDAALTSEKRALLWAVSSMCRVTLKQHQQQSLLWMSAREGGLTTERPSDAVQSSATTQRTGPLDSVRGGLQADDCGLGKTLQCVATVAAGYVSAATRSPMDDVDSKESGRESLVGSLAARVFSEPIPTPDDSNKATVERTRMAPAAVYAAFYQELCLRRSAAAPTLVVCPKAVATQWIHEIGKYLRSHEDFRIFCGISEDSELFRTVDAYMSEIDPEYLEKPLLSASLYHGGGRGGLLGTMSDAITTDIVITTYGTLRSEFSQWEGSGKSRFPNSQRCLLDVSWSRVVLDEAHTVRNINTENFKAVADLIIRADSASPASAPLSDDNLDNLPLTWQQLVHNAIHTLTTAVKQGPNAPSSSTLASPTAWRRRASARWALTATPVHNSVDDLRSVFVFLRAAPFDRPAVWKQLFEPIVPAPGKALRYVAGAAQAVAAYYGQGAKSADSRPATASADKVKLSGGRIVNGMSVGAKSVQERLQAGVSKATNGSVTPSRDMWLDLDLLAAQNNADAAALHLDIAPSNTTNTSATLASRGSGSSGLSAAKDAVVALPLWVRAAMGEADPVEGGIDRGQRRVCALLRGLMVRRLQGEVDAEVEGPVKAPWAGLSEGTRRRKEGYGASVRGPDGDSENSDELTSNSDANSDSDSDSETESETELDDESPESKSSSTSAATEIPPPVYVVHRIQPSPAEKSIFAALRFMAIRGDDEKYQKLLRDDENGDSEDDSRSKSSKTSRKSSKTSEKSLSGSAARASALTWLGQLTRAATCPLLCRGRVLTAALAWIVDREARKAKDGRVTQCLCRLHHCQVSAESSGQKSSGTTTAARRDVNEPADELSQLLGGLSINDRSTLPADRSTPTNLPSLMRSPHVEPAAEEAAAARSCRCTCGWLELHRTVVGLADEHNDDDNESDEDDSSDKDAPRADVNVNTTQNGSVSTMTPLMIAKTGTSPASAVYSKLQARTKSYMTIPPSSLAPTPSCVFYSTCTTLPHPPSSKLSYLLLLLSHIALTQPGAHVLLFSQWTTVLDAVQHALESHRGRLDALLAVCGGSSGKTDDPEKERENLPKFPRYDCKPADVRGAYRTMGLNVSVHNKDSDLLTPEELNDSLSRNQPRPFDNVVGAPHHRLFAAQTQHETLRNEETLSSAEYASFARIRRIDGTMRVKDQEAAILDFKLPVEVESLQSHRSSYTKSSQNDADEDITQLFAKMTIDQADSRDQSQASPHSRSTMSQALPLSILMISTGMGGAGLNLVEAGHVIHLDPLWNPAVRTQASARALRLGQRQTVVIHDFVVSDSVEERVCSVRRDKRLVAEAVVDGKGSHGQKTGLTLAEIKGLFD